MHFFVLYGEEAMNYGRVLWGLNCFGLFEHQYGYKNKVFNGGLSLYLLKVIVKIHNVPRN